MKTLSPEILEQMSPEKRALYEKRLKEVKRNRRLFGAVIFLGIAAVVIIIAALFLFFKVESVNVKNAGSYYTDKEIISASGLTVGDNMSISKLDSVGTRIQTMLPYVLKAEVTKSGSGSISIKITDDTAAVIFETESGYALTDKDLKVLEIISEIPEENTLCVVKTSNKTTASPGSEISLSDASEKELFEKLCDELKNANIFEEITAVDISRSTNIKVTYQNRFIIKLGTASDIATKLAAAKEAIKGEDENYVNAMGEVDVTSIKKVFVTPLDSLDTEKDKEDAEQSTDTQDSTQTSNDENDTTENTEAQSEEAQENTTAEEEENSENGDNESDDNAE